MYAPQLGRFVSQDPLAADPTLLYDNNWFGQRLTEIRNLYGYCENNPVNRVDPSGLASVLCSLPAPRAVGFDVLIGIRPQY